MELPVVGLVGLLVTVTLVGLFEDTTVLGILASTTADLTGVLLATALGVLGEGVASGEVYKFVIMQCLEVGTGLFSLASLLNMSAESL